VSILSVLQELERVIRTLEAVFRVELLSKLLSEREETPDDTGASCSSE